MPTSAGHLGFEENRGQLIDDLNRPVDYVFFKASIPGMAIYLTETGVTYVLKKSDHHNHQPGHEEKQEFSRVDMLLQQTHISRKQVVFETPLPEMSHYYLAHCPMGIRNVQKFTKVTVRNVYPGIDWVWYADDQKGLKYDFVVHPGADPAQLRLLYKWADLSADANGTTLSVQSHSGTLVEGELTSFCDGQPVDSRYVLAGNEVHFDIGTWNRERDLVIDPPLTLLWGTYFGGDSWEKNTDIDLVIDQSGNSFLTGNTFATTFPTVNPGGGAYFDVTNSTTTGIQGKGGDAVIVKFSNNGAMVWSTYFGGTLDDNGNSIACDASGDIYVTGNTSSTDFPVLVLPGAYNQIPFGASDAFLLRFDNNGVLEWSTYIGGSWNDIAYGLDIDGSGNILITGQTYSTNFPLLDPGNGAFYQSTMNGTTSDLFIMRLNAAGQQTWGTFCGGNGDELGNFIMADASGKIYVTGSSTAAGFPTFDPGGGAYYQATFAGTGTTLPYRFDQGDAVILRFSSTAVMEWSTYYGGTDSDAGRAITVEPNGTIYVTGDTRSGSTFPVQTGPAGSYNQAWLGGADAFYLKFSAACVRTWGTLFGGSGDEYSGAIIVDNCGNKYATGHSYSTDMPTTNYGNGSYFIGGNLSNDDVYVLAFDPSDALVWSSYNGTTGFDEKGTSVKLDNNGHLLVAGYWCFYSTSNGMMNPGGGAYVKTNVDADDYFIMKFDALAAGLPSSTASSTNAQCFGNCNGTATATVSGTCSSPISYLWLPGGQTTATVTGLCAGTYSVIVNDSNGYVDTLVVIVTQPPPTSAGVNGNLQIDAGDSTVLTAIGGGTYVWNTGDSTASITVSPTTTTNYSVIVFDPNGCPDTVAVTVLVEENCARSVEQITVPNVFSPNADGVNDLFEITYDAECIRGIRVEVWDRWGIQVYSGEQDVPDWDGRFRNDNKYVTDGVYYYVIRGNTATNDTFERSGFVHVLRPLD